MKSIFRGGCDRNSVSSSDYNAEWLRQAALLPLSFPSLIVIPPAFLLSFRSAAEESAVAGSPIPEPLHAAQKYLSKKRKIFAGQKSVHQAPLFTTQFTTTSPRFAITKTPQNAKTLQKPLSTTQNISSNSQHQNLSG
jgi:hypothetical protein